MHLLGTYTYPACACGEGENKKVNAEERKDRKCLGDVRSRVTAKGERGVGAKRRGETLLPSFFLCHLG